MRTGAVVAGAIALASVLATSGVTGTPAASASTSSSLTTSCRSVTNVLSEGPTPSVDFVGYAEAQILPLRKLKITDTSLKKAVSGLDKAYEKVYATNGSKASTKASAAAFKSVKRICPKVSQ
jgi:hypothetical protein